MAETACDICGGLRKIFIPSRPPRFSNLDSKPFSVPSLGYREYDCPECSGLYDIEYIASMSYINLLEGDCEAGIIENLKKSAVNGLVMKVVNENKFLDISEEIIRDIKDGSYKYISVAASFRPMVKNNITGEHE